MLRRFTILYILIIAIITFLQLPSVLAEEKQNTIKPSNTKSEKQFDRKGNAAKVTHIPVVIDPRQPDTVVSGSLGVDVRLSKPDCPWIRYSLSATLWRWGVRKPGIYSAKCLTGTVKSNVNVVINFKDFENLKSPPLLKGLHWANKCSDQEIETYYAATLADLTVDQVSWQTVSGFNQPQNDLFVPKSPCTATSWYLWNKIKVTNDISACNYKDRGFITFEISNLDTWVDPELPDSTE